MISVAPRGILAAALLYGGVASAGLLPAERPRVLLHALDVSDEQGQPHDLRALTIGQPTLLLPIFTRCSGTCPMTAVRLKDALAAAGPAFRVALLSFDTEDTARDLREFRERFALPADWLVVRAVDPAAARSFFDELDFHFMKSGGGFDHPNLTFVLSPKGARAGAFSGTAFSRDELQTAWRRALRADDPGAFGRVRDWLIRPEAWILLASAGLTSCAVAILVFARRTRARIRDARE